YAVGFARHGRTRVWGAQACLRRLSHRPRRAGVGIPVASLKRLPRTTHIPCNGAQHQAESVFAFVYNAVGIPVTAGVLYPVFGIVLSSVSSIRIIRMRILVVEDERKLGDYLYKGLTEHAYVVDIARNGVDGQHMAIHGEYDVLVL